MTTDPWEASVWDFQTPAGKWTRWHLRPHTSDWNTVNACTMVGDEYGMPKGNSGWAMDVGAHIGAVAVAYLVDNPDARMVAIEALPENARLVMLNAFENNVADRVILYGGSAAKTSEGTTWIGYGEVKDETLIHEYIGNANAPEGSRGIDATNYSLSTILDEHGIDEVEWLKIDCEGCEYEFLDSLDILRVKIIVGEVHYGA